MTDHSHISMRRILLKESLDSEFERFKVTTAQSHPKSPRPPLPQEFSIRNEMTPVEDQGFQGSCASFAVLACLEHIHKRDLSEAQVQHESEKSYGDCSEGLSVIHAFNTCKKKGSVDESLWPYDDAQVCWKTPPNVTGKQRYKFQGYARVYQRSRKLNAKNIQSSGNPFFSKKSGPGLPLTVATQQQLFVRRRPICVGVPVFWDAWPWDGNVLMPSPASLHGFFSKSSNPKVDGWHAIAVCGWSNSIGRFIFKNSWNVRWGDGGYGTIPYQYIEKYSDLAIFGW